MGKNNIYILILGLEFLDIRPHTAIEYQLVLVLSRMRTLVLFIIYQKKRGVDLLNYNLFEICDHFFKHLFLLNIIYLLCFKHYLFILSI